MEEPVIGSVVVIPFPFSNLKDSKSRPAIILAKATYGDFIFCQVTSNPYSDPLAIKITDESFSWGSLPKMSYARPEKIFTGNDQLILKTVGLLNIKNLTQITNTIISIFKNSLDSYLPK